MGKLSSNVATPSTRKTRKLKARELSESDDQEELVEEVADSEGSDAEHNAWTKPRRMPSSW